MANLTLLAESPLAHLTARLADSSGDAVSLRELPFVPMVSIRVEPSSPAHDRIGETLGLTLPDRVGETTEGGGRTALWLGPDEWLVVGLSGAAADLTPIDVEALTAALGDERGAVVDVSANRTVLQLGGERARAVLEKGCPTDLHPSAFAVGTAITTTLGPVPLLLWRVGDDAYRLLPRSSFADYTARWTLDAMAEYVEAS